MSMTDTLAAEGALIRDLLNHCFGDCLASGRDRVVYEWLPDPKLVAKIELRSRSFQNVIEAETWDRIKETKWARWFAPVASISPAGTMLLMRRTSAATRDDFPKKIPAFFTDTKLENWGRLNGQLVCHDYGIHLLMERGMTNDMRCAKWWSEKDRRP